LPLGLKEISEISEEAVALEVIEKKQEVSVEVEEKAEQAVVEFEPTEAEKTSSKKKKKV
jgi:hypothetical protein